MNVTAFHEKELILTLDEPKRRNPIGHGVRQQIVRQYPMLNATVRCVQWC